MSKLSLKITLAGRTYPLTVNEGEDEKILKAAEDINSAIKLLQENYAVKDMQDLLAMSSLQLLSKASNRMNNKTDEPDYSDIENALSDIESKLNL